jgi:hypothetical protein
VWSLSLTQETPWQIGFDTVIAAELWSSSSSTKAGAQLVGRSQLQESGTHKQWLRSPFAATSGTHSFGIAAADSAGNVDPSPAVWTWTVPKLAATVLNSAPQQVAFDSSAHFRFSCALPDDVQDAPCVYSYSLDGGEWLPVVATAAAAAGAHSNSSSSATNSSTGPRVLAANKAAVLLPPAALTTTTTTSTKAHELSSSSLQLHNLTDGEHTLQLCACTSTAPCGDAPLVTSYTWSVDTSLPRVSILAFPNTLMPSRFKFASSKGSSSSRYLCNVDSEGWSPCSAEPSFKLGDGVHTLDVLAVDPAGRRAVVPAHHDWAVSTLDTVVQYCPLSVVRGSTVSFTVQSLYNARACIAGNMECTVVYSLTKVSHLQEESCNSSGASTATPTTAGGSGSNNSGGSSSSSSAPTASPRSDPFTNVSCTEELAGAAPYNCTQNWLPAVYAETHSSDDGSGICTLTERVEGVMMTEQSLMTFIKLRPGHYQFSAQTRDRYGNVDSSAAACSWAVQYGRDHSSSSGSSSGYGVLANSSQVLLELVRYPPAIVTAHATATLLFEFSLAGTAEAVAAAKLEYFLEGPSSEQKWLPVPRVTGAHWQQLVDANALLGNDSSTSVAANSTDAAAAADTSSMVWGLELQGTGDAFYTLQARDATSEVAVSASWTIDTHRPTLTVTSQPQSPSHSATALFQFACSEPNCRAEYRLLSAAAVFTAATSTATDGAGAGTAAAGTDGSSDQPWSTLLSEQAQSADTSDDYAQSTFTLVLGSLAEGNHTVALRVYDLSDMSGPTVTVTWLIDLSKPETYVVTYPDAVQSSTAARFSFACKLADAEPSIPCEYEYQLLSSGSAVPGSASTTAGDGSSSSGYALVGAERDDETWYPTRNPVVLHYMEEGIYYCYTTSYTSSCR